MKYVVVKDFTDKNDKHVYRAGDTFPREGVEVSEERVAELTTTANMRGEILISRVDEPESKPKKAKRVKKDA